MLEKNIKASSAFYSSAGPTCKEAPVVASLSILKCLKNVETVAHMIILQISSGSIVHVELYSAFVEHAEPFCIRTTRNIT